MAVISPAAGNVAILARYVGCVGAQVPAHAAAWQVRPSRGPLPPPPGLVCRVCRRVCGLHRGLWGCRAPACGWPGPVHCGPAFGALACVAAQQGQLVGRYKGAGMPFTEHALLDGQGVTQDGLRLDTLALVLQGCCEAAGRKRSLIWPRGCTRDLFWSLLSRGSIHCCCRLGQIHWLPPPTNMFFEYKNSIQLDAGFLLGKSFVLLQKFLQLFFAFFDCLQRARAEDFEARAAVLGTGEAPFAMLYQQAVQIIPS